MDKSCQRQDALLWDFGEFGKKNCPVSQKKGGGYSPQYRCRYAADIKQEAGDMGDVPNFGI